MAGVRARALDLVQCNPAAFREYRMQAEHAVRQEAAAAGRGEIAIGDVYRRLHATGVISDAAAGIAAEFAAECEVARPVEAVLAALSARDPAQRLIFVSDTIWPGEDIAALLHACGYGDGCHVFTSADTRQSKHSGAMFDHVIRTLGCNPSDIVHIGDNPDSDVVRAREHGIATRHLPRAALPPEPDHLKSENVVVRLLHSHRRAQGTESDDGIGPPGQGLDLHRYLTGLLIGFTLFVLAEARRRGIGRIYFLARDGYLPLAVARRLGRDGKGPELTYLHVSRQAIIVPAMIDDIPRLAEAVGANLQGRPIGAALECLGIEPSAVPGLLGAAGLDPAQRIAGREGQRALEALFGAGHTAIRERLEARRDHALSYLAQSGFLEPGPRLIVDVGWRGNTQRALSLLTGIPSDDVVGCYLGLLPEALRPGLGPRNAAGYLFSFGDPRWLMEVVLEGYILLELFFSAPHGSVLDYASSPDGVAPVHAVEAEPGGGIRRRALAALEAGCLREFDALDAIFGGLWPEAIDPASALTDLVPLLTRPSPAEIARVNTVPFIHGADGTQTAVACNPVPLHEWLLNPSATVTRIGRAAWRSGTLRASLPWPIPPMSYGQLEHRMRRLQRLIRR
ncbi:MAG: HAD hydrolase-like protein [Acetobacteraceae bacterium]